MGNEASYFGQNEPKISGRMTALTAEAGLFLPIAGKTRPESTRYVFGAATIAFSISGFNTVSTFCAAIGPMSL